MHTQTHNTNETHTHTYRACSWADWNPTDLWIWVFTGSCYRGGSAWGLYSGWFGAGNLVISLVFMGDEISYCSNEVRLRYWIQDKLYRITRMCVMGVNEANFYRICVCSRKIS